MVPSTIYFRLRLIAAGTFTAGAGLDWSTQFDDSAIATSYFPLIGGEMSVGELTTGACADVAFYSTNPFDTSVWVEASVGAPLQLYVNGTVTEITVSAEVTISAIRGYNVIKLSRVAGPLLLCGRFLSQLGLSRWESLYSVGGDPIIASSGGGGNSGEIGVIPLSRSGTSRSS